MANYYVYWDKLLRRVQIHRSACVACNNGETRNENRIKVGLEHTYEWIPAESYAAARSIADAKGRRNNFKVNCVLCEPQQPTPAKSTHRARRRTLD